MNKEFRKELSVNKNRASIDKAIPILFTLFSFSPKRTIAKTTDNTTIPMLLRAKIIDPLPLKILESSALIMKNIDPKLTAPRPIPIIHAFLDFKPLNFDGFIRPIVKVIINETKKTKDEKMDMLLSST